MCSQQQREIPRLHWGFKVSLGQSATSPGPQPPFSTSSTVVGVGCSHRRVKDQWGQKKQEPPIIPSTPEILSYPALQRVEVGQRVTGLTGLQGSALSPSKSTGRECFSAFQRILVTTTLPSPSLRSPLSYVFSFLLDFGLEGAGEMIQPLSACCFIQNCVQFPGSQSGPGDSVSSS